MKIWLEGFYKVFGSFAGLCLGHDRLIERDKVGEIKGWIDKIEGMLYKL